MEINLEKLRSYSHYRFYSGSDPQARALKFMLDEIYSLIDINEIKIVYPKNLFIDSKQIEIYCFLYSGHMIKITSENNELKILSRYCKDIISLEHKINLNTVSKSLMIQFSDGEAIELDSMNDTNLHHREKFDTLIVEIYKLLGLSKLV